MSDPTRSVPDYVKAAQAGDDAANALVAPLLGWTRGGPCPEWHDADDWMMPEDVWWRRDGDDDAWFIWNIRGEAPTYATGHDGRLLVEVLDALAKVVAPVTVVAGGTPQFGAWATVAVFLDRYDCNWFIAASAALLVSLNQLQEK